jgi:Na+-driven multidrug efflux pump
MLGVWQGLVLSLVLGVAVAAALVLGADDALLAMGAPADSGRLFELSREYLLVRAAAAPAALAMTVGQGAFRGIKVIVNPKP